MSNMKSLSGTIKELQLGHDLLRTDRLITVGHPPLQLDMAKNIPLNDKFPIVNPVASTMEWVLLFDFFGINSGTGIMHLFPTRCAFYHHCI